MPALKRIALTIGVIVAIASAVRAMYLQVDIDNVPIARLVANLERLIREKPNDANLHVNLARTHAMAWAQRTEDVDIARGYERWGPWFGREPDAVPFAMSPTRDAARLKAAEPHLQEALREYAEAIRLAPNNLIALLGQAWLTEKSGDRTKAITQYRAIVERAYTTESVQRAMGRPITEEAAGYLVSLLDPERDREEIATLRARVDRIKALPRPITPIVIPLRDGLTVDALVAPQMPVRFDADGSGLRKAWTWITPDGGWLVYNQRTDPSVTSALQLFGNVTFWLFWDDGYDALCALDDDGDFSLSGAELAHMAVWQDRNSNGRSESGEVRPLHAWGIQAVSCRHEIIESHDDVAAWSSEGVTLSDGRHRPTWDVLLSKRVSQ